MGRSLRETLRQHACVTLTTETKFYVVGSIVPSIRHDLSREFRGRSIVENIRNGHLQAPHGRAAMKAVPVYRRLLSVSLFLFANDGEFLDELSSFLRRCEIRASDARVNGWVENS